LTSVDLVTKKLYKVQNKKAVQGCCDTLKENLRRFRDIKETIADRRKAKEILHVSKGSGHMLKCKENSVVVPLLDYAFMEANIRERRGGGLQSHPSLLGDTLYRTLQNNTDMKCARELVIDLSNPDFKISLSCCYNYTQN